MQSPSSSSHHTQPPALLLRPQTCPLLRLPRDVLHSTVTAQGYCDAVMRRSLYVTCTQLHSLLLQDSTTLTLRWAHDLTDHRQPILDTEGHQCFPLRAASEWSTEQLTSFVPRFFASPHNQVGGRRHFEKLQKLEVWDAGTLLPALAEALLHTPLPALTHLLLHTESTPVATRVAMLTRGMLGDPTPEEAPEAMRRWLAYPPNARFMVNYDNDQDLREELPLLPPDGRRLGEAWRKGNMPQLHTLGLRNVLVEGEFLAAWLEGTGWWSEEEEEEAAAAEKEAGGAGGDKVPALVTLDLGGTDMGQQGARALVSAFRRPTAVPLRSLSMGWWGEPQWESVHRVTIPVEGEEGGGGEGLLGQILGTPACRQLESLGLDECVALTPDEMISLTRFLTEGHGRQLHELRLAYLLEYRLTIAIAETELMTSLTCALVGPQLCSPFLQVLELNGCRLQGEPIRYLAEGLGRDCWPALRKLRLPSYNVDPEGITALMQGLGSGRKRGEQFSRTAQSLRVLQLTEAPSGMEEYVSEEVFSALFAGLTSGACPCLEELEISGDAVTDDVLETGLVYPIRQRCLSEHDTDLGPVAPFLGTLQVLRMRHTSLSSDTMDGLCKSLIICTPVLGEERGSLRRLQELNLDQQRDGGVYIGSHISIGDEGMQYLVHALRFLPALEVLSLEDCDLHEASAAILKNHMQAERFAERVVKQLTAASSHLPGPLDFPYNALPDNLQNPYLKEVRLGSNFEEDEEWEEEEEEDEEEDCAEEDGDDFSMSWDSRMQHKRERGILGELLRTVERRNKVVREWNDAVRKHGASTKWLANECRIDY